MMTSRQVRDECLKPSTTGPKDDGETDSDSVATDSTTNEQGSGDGDVYEVEKILSEKKMNGEAHFLIKWAGYPEEESSWEPECNILDESIIASWRVDLTRQKAGILKPFDLAAWEAKVERFNEGKDKRKARRAEKRDKMKRKKLSRRAVGSSKGLSKELDDEPLFLRKKLRRAHRLMETSDEDEEAPLASMRMSSEKHIRKKRQKTQETYDESGSEDSLMADLKVEEERRQQPSDKGNQLGKNEGEENTRVQHRNFEAKKPRSPDSPDAASPPPRGRELLRASFQVAVTPVIPSHHSGSRDPPQRTSRSNVMSTADLRTAPITSAVSSEPRRRGRLPGSSRGGATRAGIRGRGRRGSLPATSHVFSRSEVPLARKKDLSAALLGPIAEAECIQPDLSTKLSHVRRLEIAGRMKADRAPDLAVLGGLINPSEIKDSRSAYQPLKPGRESRQPNTQSQQPDNQSRQPSGNDTIHPSFAAPSRRSSTARVRFVDDSEEELGENFDEPNPIVQSPTTQTPILQSSVMHNQSFQGRGIRDSSPKAQVGGTKAILSDAPSIGKIGNINPKPKPILRVPSNSSSTEWKFQQPSVPRSFTMPSPSYCPLPTKSTEAVRPALDQRPSTGERKRVSWSEYSARQGIEKSGHLVKQAVFGLSDPTEILISFNGVSRSSEEPWVKEIISLDVVHFNHVCSAIDFQAQPIFLGAKVLAHGSIAANNDAAILLDRAAEHLRLRLGGLAFNHLSTAILLYPSRLDEWKFLEKADIPNASSVAVRYHIFELPRFYPKRAGSLTGNLFDTAKLSPPYWPSVVEFFCSLKYESLLSALPVPGKGEQKRVEPDRHNFFLLIPQNASPSPRFLTAWLKSCKPTCKVLSSAKSGSWSAFVTFLHETKSKSVSGTLLIHESLIHQIPKLPNLQSLLARNVSIFSLNSYPVPTRNLGLEDPAPAAMVRTRLFPHGAAFFLTPSLILADPDQTYRFLYWFKSKQKNSTPRTYKLLSCHGMREFLLDSAMGKASELYNLVAQANGQDIESEAERRGITYQLNNQRFKLFKLVSDIMENADAALPPYYDIEDMEDEERPIIYAADHIAYDNEPELLFWFAGWAIMNMDKYRKFFVIGTDHSNIHKAVRIKEMLMKSFVPSDPPSMTLENSLRWKRSGFTAGTEVTPAPLFSAIASASHLSPPSRSPLYQASDPGNHLPNSDASMGMNIHGRAIAHIDGLPHCQQPEAEESLEELEAKIAYFEKSTGSTSKQAIHYLGHNRADLEAALESYRLDPNQRSPTPDTPVQQPRPVVPGTQKMSQPSSRPASRSFAVTEEAHRRIVPSSLQGNGTTRPETAVRPGYVAPEDKEVWRRSRPLSMPPRNFGQNAMGHLTNSRQKQISTDESQDVVIGEADQDSLSSPERQDVPPPLPTPEADGVISRCGSSSTGMFVPEKERSSSIASSTSKQDMSKPSPTVSAKSTRDWYRMEEKAGRGWSHIKVMGIMEAIDSFKLPASSEP